MNKYDNDQIIWALQKGSLAERNDVVRHLYKNCYAQVLNFILQNSGSKEDCEDLFQDAIEVFYNQIQRNKFKGNSTASTYLIGIARNLWFVRLRKRKFLEVNLSDAIEIIDEDVSYTYQNISLFNALFNQLESDCQSILKYAYFHNLSIKEILSKFSSLKNEQSVRTKKYRCLKYLIAIFKKNNVNKDSFEL